MALREPEARGLFMLCRRARKLLNLLLNRTAKVLFQFFTGLSQHLVLLIMPQLRIHVSIILLDRLLYAPGVCWIKLHQRDSSSSGLQRMLRYFRLAGTYTKAAEKRAIEAHTEQPWPEGRAFNLRLLPVLLFELRGDVGLGPVPGPQIASEQRCSAPQDHDGADEQISQ